MAYHDHYWVNESWRPEDQEAAIEELHKEAAAWISGKGVQNPTLPEQHFAFDVIARKKGARQTS